MFVKFWTLLFRTDFDRMFYKAGSTELKKFNLFALPLGRVHSQHSYVKYFGLSVVPLWGLYLHSYVKYFGISFFLHSYVKFFAGAAFTNFFIGVLKP